MATVFPSTQWEFLVFAFFLASYGALAGYIAVSYRIIFDNRIPWDAYFSFDNRSIVLTGGGFERHPLSNYFFGMMRKTALFFSGNMRSAEFRLFYALTSAFTVALANLQIFKYLKNIIRLPLGLSLMLTLFFGIFSTALLLAFTPETYTYTLFLLCLYNYYAALKLRKGQPISILALTAGTVAVGGLTVTNASKIFFPVFEESGLWKSRQKIYRAVVRCAAAVVVFVMLYLNRLNFDFARIMEKTGQQYEKFSKPKVTPYWDMVSSWFFGGNVLFPGFVVRDYHNGKGFHYKAIFMDVYSAAAPYVFVAFLILLLVWSVIANRRNALVRLLAYSLLFDIIIHCVLKFGLHTSYIYGGHFVFVYPLLIGWLLSSLKAKPLVLSGVVGITAIMLIYLGINNFYRMSEFFLFLERFYQ